MVKAGTGLSKAVACEASFSSVSNIPDPPRNREVNHPFWSPDGRRFPRRRLDDERFRPAVIRGRSLARPAEAANLRSVIPDSS